MLLSVYHMRLLRLALAVQRYDMLAWLSDPVSGFSRLSDFFSLPISLSHQFKCHTADMKPNHQRDVRWVEGLRGITALLIVTGHIFMALDDRLASPARSEHSLPSPFQLPIVRLVISGRASLSIFFLLTGFVNSLSFLKQVRAANQHAALPGLAKSSFRRIGRMMLPAAAATSVSWGLCHLGAYRLAKRGEVAWFRDISPTPKSSFTAAVWDLLRSLWTTWAKSSNEYDKVQWNLFFLLKASLIVYTTLLMTTFVTPRARKICLILYYIYGWMSNDVLIAMNVCAGMFIVELFYDQADAKPTTVSPSLRRALPILVLIAGMIIAGYPEKNAEWCLWSKYLKVLGAKIFVPGAELSRAWGSVGTSLMLLGILYLPPLQASLSHPFLVWMGKVSFSIFLIHSFLIRSVFCWMLYGYSVPVETTGEDGTIHVGHLPPAKGINLLIICCIFFPLLYFMGHLWTAHVESRCTELAQWLEDRMVGKDTHLDRAAIPK